MVGGDKADITALCHRPLQRHLKIHDLDLVLDKGALGLPVLPTDFSIGNRDAVALAQQPGATIGKRIDVMSRSRRGETVELRARAIDVAGMEEQVEAIVGAVERSADK